ncbi:glycophorin-C-like [Thalassophryne amazonica]|uniref:glycophorin-C-like n=1 Tax=Thalassophryne amazonica TaxID=390379 RepID=UPI0014709C68|nr:glycophorin-C-like [Thalassophryne amazonica]
MDHFPVTPSPGGPTSARSPDPDLVTRIMTHGLSPDHEDLAALIGGIISAVLLILICIIALLLWCLSRHKGSYVTGEMDDDEDSEEGESVASDAALQSKQALKAGDDD